MSTCHKCLITLDIFGFSRENFYFFAFLVLLALPKGMSVENKYGYAQGVNYDGNIFYAYGRYGDYSYLDDDSDSFLNNIYKIFASDLLNINGRLSQKAYWWGYVGGNMLLAGLIFLLVGFLKLFIDLFNINLVNQNLVLMMYIWPTIALITASIRRLHDAYISSYWLFLSFVPFVSIFTTYNLIVKKSWYITVKPET